MSALVSQIQNTLMKKPCFMLLKNPNYPQRTPLTSCYSALKNCTVPGHYTSIYIIFFMLFVVCILRVKCWVKKNKIAWKPDKFARKSQKNWVLRDSQNLLFTTLPLSSYHLPLKQHRPNSQCMLINSYFGYKLLQSLDWIHFVH